MAQFRQIQNPRDAALVKAPSLPALDAEELQRHQPDAHWILMDAAQEAVARCSLWWNNTPPYSAERLGVIGHYAARDAVSARLLLQHACDQLAARRCTLAVGPMDGNTWRRYRLITERGSEPIFFLEPDNPDDWRAHFSDFGFQPLAQYSSALNTDLSKEDPRVADKARQLEAQGIRIRRFDTRRQETELHAIYEVSCVSFRDNFLYTPISEAEFTEQYRRILPYVRPEFVFMVEKDARLIGYLFALPDLMEAKRGEPMRTLIFKTIAVLPEFSGTGIGHCLFAEGHRAARRLGFTRVIHALMFDDNRSRRLSAYYAQTMRRYTLFSKKL
jgi:GNAT superfamily N-acetyltransferase